MHDTNSEKLYLKAYHYCRSLTVTLYVVVVFVADIDVDVGDDGNVAEGLQRLFDVYRVYPELVGPVYLLYT